MLFGEAVNRRGGATGKIAGILIVGVPVAVVISADPGDRLSATRIAADRPRRPEPMGRCAKSHPPTSRPRRRATATGHLTEATTDSVLTRARQLAGCLGGHSFRE